MLQKLLTERFHLVLHRETREMSRYRLVVAKGGLKLSPAQKLPEYKDDEERKAAMEKQTRAKPGGPEAQAPGGAISQIGVGQRHDGETGGDPLRLCGSTSDGPYRIRGVVLVLAGVVAGRVGSSGQLTPFDFRSGRGTIGLKLEREKGPVEFLVIERAEKTPAVN